MRPARSSARPLSILAAACVATVVAVACSVGQARVGGGGERAMAAARSADRAGACTRDFVGPADRSRHRHQQHHPRHRDHAREPLVRSLLRHVPRRGRIPAGRAGPHRRVRPRPAGRDLSTALSRHEPVRRGRPPRTGGLGDRRRRRRGWTGSSGRWSRSATDAGTTPTSSSAGRPSGVRAASRTSWGITPPARSRTTGRTRSTSCCRTTCSRRSRRGRFPPTCSSCRAGRRPVPTSATR